MSDIELAKAEEDALAMLSQDEIEEFYLNKTRHNGLFRFDRVVINEDAKFILIDGDIDLFRDVITDENIEKIFNQKLCYVKNGNALVMCTPQNMVDDLDTRELLYIEKNLILKAIKELYLTSNLTSAEYSLLLDLVSGISAKESSIRDDVSYHTRRNQVKSIIEKFSVNGQTELIRNVIASISLALGNNYADSNNQEHEKIVSYFLDNVFDKKLRLHNIQTQNQEALRAIDFGPISGHPVILCHGQFSFFPPNFGYEWLQENNIRILMPLRPGYYETLDKLYRPDEYIQKSTMAIDQLIDIFGLVQPTILTLTSGVAFGLEYARLHGEKIKKLVLVSSSYVGVLKNQKQQKIRRGLIALGSQNHLVMKKIVDFYLKKIDTPERALKLMVEAAKGSKSDQEVSRKMMIDWNLHAASVAIIKNSWQSFVMSILIPDERVWRDLEQIQCPMLFVHGEDNPIDKMDDLRQMHERCAGSQLIELEDIGQYVATSEISEFLKYVLDDFDPENS